MSYHGRMMNIQSADFDDSYRFGHRDARHAAEAFLQTPDSATTRETPSHG